MLALEFPPINEILRWDDLIPHASTRSRSIAVLAALIAIGRSSCWPAEPGRHVAPKGVRNLAETIVEFIENQIIMPTMGKDGLGGRPSC